MRFIFLGYACALNKKIWRIHQQILKATLVPKGLFSLIITEAYTIYSSTKSVNETFLLYDSGSGLRQKSWLYFIFGRNFSNLTNVKMAIL